jgi:hypothetical protein
VPLAARNALTLIPSAALAVNTTYTVNIVGTGFTSPLNYTFTTGATASGGAVTTTATATGTVGSLTIGTPALPPLLIPTQTPLATPTATPGIPAYPTPPPIISAPVGAISFERIPADATNGGFYNQWRRADDPVFFGKASRSWTFGDQPYGFSILLEPYQGQLRIVNYHDKARMEASNAASDNITNGLLVREMISGNAQVGDNIFIPRPPAYNVAVAGDVAETNINAPTYYSFYNIASLNNDHRIPVQTGQTVIATVGKDGTINVNPGTAVYGVQNVYYDNNLGHNIPNVFWDFMNRSGVINLGGIYTSGQVSDWLPTFGLPLTDAYWTRIIVGGQEKDVLLQLFERRVLTFTPSNPDPFKVEMGNVGRHYFKWRYGVNY